MPSPLVPLVHTVGVRSLPVLSPHPIGPRSAGGDGGDDEGGLCQCDPAQGCAGESGLDAGGGCCGGAAESGALQAALEAKAGRRSVHSAGRALTNKK
eukprot:1157283-Pyramimonas_sp.AAC.1